LISKVVDQLQIKENLNVLEMSEETLLQYLKDESINLYNDLIALLSNLNVLKNLIEGYILEYDKNVEALKQFVEKGLIEIFGNIPNYSNQMELTKINCLKNYCFCTNGQMTIKVILL
jgi:hypothetical protein